MLSLVNELKVEADLENSGFRDRIGDLIDVVEDSTKKILIIGLIDVVEDSAEKILDPALTRQAKPLPGI